MTAEEIVRRLAAEGPPKVNGVDEEEACGACGASLLRILVSKAPLEIRDPTKDDHRPDCLWRLAVEWVAADAARVRATKHCSRCGHLPFAIHHTGPSGGGCCAPKSPGSVALCGCDQIYGEDCPCGDYPNHTPGTPNPKAGP